MIYLPEKNTRIIFNFICVTEGKIAKCVPARFSQLEVHGSPNTDAYTEKVYKHEN